MTDEQLELARMMRQIGADERTVQAAFTKERGRSSWEGTSSGTGVKQGSLRMPKKHRS